MMDDFAAAEIQTGETIIFVRSYGSGPPILLLHGFPQTHLMWRSVAPLLARNFTVICADLRGYGRSGCPVSTPDHAPYAKRAMAQDMVTVMERLGFSRFPRSCPATEKRGNPSRSITVTMSCAMARFAYGAWSGVETGPPPRP